MTRVTFYHLLRGIVLVILLLVLPLNVASGQSDITLAQPTPTGRIDVEDGDGPLSEKVDFYLGDNIYRLDPNYAVNACIEKVEMTVSDATLTIRLFGRVDTPAMFEPLGTFVSETAEQFEVRGVGYCLPMEVAR